LNRTTIAE